MKRTNNALKGLMLAELEAQIEYVRLRCEEGSSCKAAFHRRLIWLEGAREKMRSKFAQSFVPESEKEGKGTPPSADLRDNIGAAVSSLATGSDKEPRHLSA